MRQTLLSLAAATAAIGCVATTADARPLRTIVYAEPVPVGLSPDEVLDYRMDQLERRQEMDRERLRFTQKIERRTIDPDED